MKQPTPDDAWPDTWKSSFPYDMAEVFGDLHCRGYSYAYQNRQRHTLRLMTEAVPPGSKVLDIAAAQGNFSLLLAENGYQVTWNDLREDLAEYVKLKHEFGHVRYAPGNVFEIAFDDLFDAVLITEIIEHVAHPDEFLQKVSTLVKPGGVVVMTTPNGAYFKNTLPKFSEFADPSVFEAVQFKPNSDGHIFLLHPEEIEALSLQAGLRVEELTLFTTSLTNGHVKTEPLLHLMPRGFVDAIETATTMLPERVRCRLMVHMAARFRRL